MKTRLFCALALAASMASADDIKTTNGKEYKNAVVTRIEPDGIVIRFSAGVVKLAFADLPSETQKKYGYDAAAIALRASEEKRLAAQRQAEEKNWLDAIEKAGIPKTELTLQDFEEVQFDLVGKIVKLHFNYRASVTRRIDKDWFSGLIFRRDPDAFARSSIESADVLIPTNGIDWFQAIPTDYVPIHLVVYAKVEATETGRTVLRLLGTQLHRSANGTAEIGW